MTKTEVLKSVELEGVKLTAKQKEDFLAQFENAVIEAVNVGEKVKTGLGTYSKKEVASRRIAGRTMIHPVTKQEIVIEEGMTEAKTVLQFKTKIEF